MSNSSLSFKQQRKIVTDFIESHADNLQGITKTSINKLENANTDEFIELIENIKIKAGRNFYIFRDFSGDESRKHLSVWITKTPNECIYEWEQLGCYKNITPVRMSNLERLFASIFKKQKAKKPAQSTTKKTDSNKSQRIIQVKRKIAFLDVSDKSIQHAMYAGGDTIDISWSTADDKRISNQIDHVINAYNCAIKEFRSIVAELELAKANGATHVIDSSYCKPEHFQF